MKIYINIKMEEADSPPPSPPPLKRGRPRKQEFQPESLEESPPPVKKRGRPRKVADIEDLPELPQEPVKRKRKRKLPENPQPKDVSFQSRKGTVQFTALKRFAPELVEPSPAAPVNERRAHLSRLFDG